MIGLGILAAGAAQGAANASNMNVQAQNVLEIDQNREALREEYLNRRFDKELAVGRENAKAAGALRDAEYQRKRTDTLTDNEIKHKQTLEIEGRKDKRTAASNATRLQAAAMRKAGSGEQSVKAQSPIGKEAEDYKRTGLAKDDHAAYRLAAMNRASEIIMANPLNAAKSPTELLTAIKDYANKLYPDMDANMSGEQPAKLERYKLEDLIK